MTNNDYIKDNPSNHSKQGEAVEKQLKKRWLIKNIIAFFGWIVLSLLLNHQLVNRWHNDPFVTFVFSFFMLFLFLVSSTSLWRSIRKYNDR